MADGDPDKSQCVLRTKLQNEIRKLWADIVKELCENSFGKFASPCKCLGNDPLSLVGDPIREGLGLIEAGEFPEDDQLFSEDPFSGSSPE